MNYTVLFLITFLLGVVFWVISLLKPPMGSYKTLEELYAGVEELIVLLKSSNRLQEAETVHDAFRSGISVSDIMAELGPALSRIKRPLPKPVAKVFARCEHFVYSYRSILKLEG